jgi:hypothetical protein
MPRWMHFSGPKYPALAPTPAMLKMDAKSFEVAYHAQLAALDPRQVYVDLVALAGIDAVLLCHEKPGVPCHRLTVARWLEAALGIDVPELDAPIVTGGSTDPEAVELCLIRQLSLDV